MSPPELAQERRDRWAAVGRLTDHAVNGRVDEWDALVSSFRMLLDIKRNLPPEDEAKVATKLADIIDLRVAPVT